MGNQLAAKPRNTEQHHKETQQNHFGSKARDVGASTPLVWKSDGGAGVASRTSPPHLESSAGGRRGPWSERGCAGVATVQGVLPYPIACQSPPGRRKRPPQKSQQEPWTVYTGYTPPPHNVLHVQHLVVPFLVDTKHTQPLAGFADSGLPQVPPQAGGAPQEQYRTSCRPGTDAPAGA